MSDDAMHDSLARLPDRFAESFTRALKRTRITVDVPATDWRVDYRPSGTTTTTTTLSVCDPFGWTGGGGTLSSSTYLQPRTIETRRKRSLALPVAIGHAVFFLALALAGWLR